MAVCVPPTPAENTCTAASPGYAGQTKERKNICCQVGQEPGPAGGASAPYCQPKSASACVTNEYFVQGTGTYQSEKRCCPNNTVPAHHPNGLPFCANSSVPTVTITSPVSGYQFATGASLLLSATFTTPPGSSIKEGRLYVDGKLDWTWKINPSVWLREGRLLSNSLLSRRFAPEPKVYTIKFEVTDQAGRTASAERQIIPAPDTTPPVVEITAPLVGLVDPSIQRVIVSARATDQSGIGDFKICINASCTGAFTQTCTTTKNNSYAFCTASIPRSMLFSNPPVLGVNSTVTAIALDRAYDPNQGADGMIFYTISNTP